MKTLQTAQARLELALSRIEQAAQDVASGGGRVVGLRETRPAQPAPEGSRAEIAGLSAENARLVARNGELETENARLAKALKALETKHAALKDRSQKAVSRLDSTIARVDDLFTR